MHKILHKAFIYFTDIDFYNQAWTFAPYIGQCPVINRVMPDKSCFRTDEVVRREIKEKIISYWRLKTRKHSISVGLSCSGFSFYEHVNRHMQIFLYSFRCVSIEIFYTNTLLFFCLDWDSFSSEKLYMSLHSTKNL